MATAAQLIPWFEAWTANFMEAVTEALPNPHLLLVILATTMTGFIGVLYISMLLNTTVPKTLPLDDFVPFTLRRKEVLSHDTAKFTFALKTPFHVLGLPTGQHIALKFTDSDGKAVQRSYTPVTDNTTLGEFSLVVKVYQPAPPKFPAGGKMSQHLDAMKIGDRILMQGPKGHTEWKGKGHFTVKPLGKPVQARFSRNIAMMAGGTGITPMLQVLHHIFHDPTDTATQVKLIYANQTENDILVREELEALQKEFPKRFSLWYTVDRVEEGDNWKYDTGFITKTMIEQHLSFDNKEQRPQFFMCGPPPMLKFACQPALQELGYSENDWVVF
jgi:cytochrome-b5 reductase